MPQYTHQAVLVVHLLGTRRAWIPENSTSHPPAQGPDRRALGRRAVEVAKKHRNSGGCHEVS